MAPRKVGFALAARTAITAVAEAAERVAELDAIYKASGFQPASEGGTNPITDVDLDGHNMTAANLVDVSTFATNLDKFMNNDVPLQFDYTTAINAFRSM